MTVKCNSCGQPFEGYKELAFHISTSKKGHRKGKIWAAKYIHRNVVNKRDIKDGGRIPLTEEQKQAIRQTV